MLIPDQHTQCVHRTVQRISRSICRGRSVPALQHYSRQPAVYLVLTCIILPFSGDFTCTLTARLLVLYPAGLALVKPVRDQGWCHVQRGCGGAAWHECEQHLGQ